MAGSIIMYTTGDRYHNTMISNSCDLMMGHAD